MSGVLFSRANLKAACVALLNERATEHPARHQSKYVARYILASASGARIAMMFEKGDRTPAHLWMELRFARALSTAEAAVRVYPASALYLGDQQGREPAYGRHAGLKPMRELAQADLARLTVESVAQLAMVLDQVVMSN